MRCSSAILSAGLLVGGALAASAHATESDAGKFGAVEKASQSKLSAKQQALAEFDANGDGKLSESERRAARTALQRKRREAQTALASEGSNYGSGGPQSPMNPYGPGNAYGGMTGYSSGSYPYGTTSSYYYYGMGVMGQSSVGGSGMGGMGGGGCMMGGGSATPSARR